MRILLAGVLVLAGCDNLPFVKKDQPDLVNILCLQHESSVDTAELSLTGKTDSDKRYAAATACLWKQAVDLAPAPDNATIIAKVVMQQCELTITGFTAALLNEKLPNASIAEKAEVIEADRKSWEAEALTYVVTARAAKCTNPNAMVPRLTK